MRSTGRDRETNWNGQNQYCTEKFFFFFFSLSFLFSLLPDFYLVRSGSLQPVAIPSPTIV